MPDRQPSLRKTHVTTERPPFERIALVLQGGGALGAYQGGVYQALAEANLHPDWVAGISIGAINSALIAGNPPEKRVERLREFWETSAALRLEYPAASLPIKSMGHKRSPSQKVSQKFCGQPKSQLPRYQYLDWSKASPTAGLWRMGGPAAGARAAVGHANLLARQCPRRGQIDLRTDLFTLIPGVAAGADNAVIKSVE